MKCVHLLLVTVQPFLVCLRLIQKRNQSATGLRLLYFVSEIFVSAPYENVGEGALYIFSGFEVNKKLMKSNGYTAIPISQLKLTQRIQNRKFHTFGYSLQVVPDVDGNGCDGNIYYFNKNYIILPTKLHNAEIFIQKIDL